MNDKQITQKYMILFELEDDYTKDDVKTHSKKYIQEQFSKGNDVDLDELYLARDILIKNVSETTQNKDNVEGFYVEEETESVDLITVPLNEEKTSEEITSLTKDNNKKNLTFLINNGRLTFLSWIIIVVVLIAAISIPITVSTVRSNRYQNLLDDMTQVRTYNDLITIEEEIEKLPFDYRNTEDIRLEIRSILNDAERLSSIYVGYNNTSADEFLEARQAYFRLYDVDQTAVNWNLSDYLESIDYRILLVNKYWSGSGYYFNLYQTGEENQITLSTDLPNDKDYNEDYYYFYYDYTHVFGYELQSDTDDEFDAYKIISVSEDKLVIYSYTTETRYNLTTDDE